MDKAALDAFMTKEQPKIDRGKAKAKAARKREEEIFQRACKNYLNFNFTTVDDEGIAHQQFPFWAVRNETPPPPDGINPHDWAMRQGRRAKDMGVLAGVSDWHFLLNSKFRVIELKVPGGSVSKAQKRYLANVKRQGGDAHVAWNMDEFHAIISSWLPVRYDPALCNERSAKQLRQQVAMKELYKNDDED